MSIFPLQYISGIFLHYTYQDLHVMFVLENHGQLENERNYEMRTADVPKL